MTRERNAIDSLGDLFGSKARALVLAALASAGGEDVTASEVARQQGITVQEAAKQLHLLEGIGLLGSERRGRLKPYSVSEDSPIWPARAGPRSISRLSQTTLFGLPPEGCRIHIIRVGHGGAFPPDSLDQARAEGYGNGAYCLGGTVR